jgi:hypothetical protein
VDVVKRAALSRTIAAGDLLLSLNGEDITQCALNDAAKKISKCGLPIDVRFRRLPSAGGDSGSSRRR